MLPPCRHLAMRPGQKTVPIPNPHGDDLDRTLVKRILRQAGIDPARRESLWRRAAGWT